MSDVPDLTEAVEAAARAAHGPGWENALPMLQHSWRERLTPIIGAAYEPIRAAVRDLTPTEQADAIGGLIEVQWMCEPLRFRVVGPWRERVLVCTEVSNA